LAQLPNKSWKAGETLKVLPSSTLIYQQKLSIGYRFWPKRCGLILGAQGVELGIVYSDSPHQDRIAMIGRNDIPDAGALHRRRSEFKGKRRHRISQGRCSLEPAQTQLAYHSSFGGLNLSRGPNCQRPNSILLASTSQHSHGV
jgi:hypothetical protein